VNRGSTIILGIAGAATSPGAVDLGKPVWDR
jgi:hypothetical protein